jgi:hypothetical protein
VELQEVIQYLDQLHQQVEEAEVEEHLHQLQLMMETRRFRWRCSQLYCTSPTGGGTGNTPPVSPHKEYPGGSATCGRGGAGGAGASAAGGIILVEQVEQEQIQLQYYQVNSVTYAGGGGGGSVCSGGTLEQVEQAGVEQVRKHLQQQQQDQLILVVVAEVVDPQEQAVERRSRRFRNRYRKRIKQGQWIVAS